MTTLRCGRLKKRGSIREKQEIHVFSKVSRPPVGSQLTSNSVVSWKFFLGDKMAESRSRPLISRAEDTSEYG
jgi:hypothetical protein